jgi:hypothetical protein
MKKLLACIVVSAALVPVGALAHERERIPDAGLGALAGGLAFGWQGAAAGAATGYIAGPSISRALGLSGRRHYRHRRRHRR